MRKTDSRKSEDEILDEMIECTAGAFGKVANGYQNWTRCCSIYHRDTFYYDIIITVKREIVEVRGWGTDCYVKTSVNDPSLHDVYRKFVSEFIKDAF